MQVARRLEGESQAPLTRLVLHQWQESGVG